ncbi:MAG: hypothetical protein K2H77_03440, partial [Alistipes sp.]|nr:hypothetical protein [Alistipes sp.]
FFGGLLCIRQDSLQYIGQPFSYNLQQVAYAFSSVQKYKKVPFKNSTSCLPAQLSAGTAIINHYI